MCIKLELLKYLVINISLQFYCRVNKEVKT
jgi:hypothetical protein